MKQVNEWSRNETMNELAEWEWANSYFNRLPSSEGWSHRDRRRNEWMKGTCSRNERMETPASVRSSWTTVIYGAVLSTPARVWNKLEQCTVNKMGWHEEGEEWAFRMTWKRIKPRRAYCSFVSFLPKKRKIIKKKASQSLRRIQISEEWGVWTLYSQ